MQIPFTWNRPGWDAYFLIGAHWVAMRADCRRGRYGAVLVKNNRVISTGYNGAPSGKESCLKGDCPRGLKSREELGSHLDGNHNYSDCISLHAEANAIAYADGDKCRGATLYLTGPPCDMCSKLIRAAGIVRVVWK
jgi:dCMP deaminase